MTAKEQIEDARYFVDVLKNKSDRTEARAVVSPVLAITRSIPDHLLEEYNVKLYLDIPMKQHLRLNEACREAIQSNNLRAIDFLKLYMNELKVLYESKCWRIIKKKREIKIRVKYPKIRRRQQDLFSQLPCK